MRTIARSLSVAFFTALGFWACGSDDEGGGGGKTGGAGGVPSGGAGGSSAAGGTSGGAGGAGGSGASAGSGATGGSTGGGAGTGGGDGGVTPPAYDQHTLDRLQCKFDKGALTTETVGPSVPHGDALPFQHVVVLMMENRSFDHYFSKLPAYGVKDVDVATDQDSNPDPANGNQPVYRFHETRFCIEDVNHDWEPVHEQWNLGKNDGFVKTNNPGGARAMGYHDQNDFPFYYWMAKTFSTSDRFFSSTLGPTWPNRFFFYAGTSWGNTKTETVDPIADPIYKTAPRITDLMKSAGRSWKVYRDGLLSFASIFGFNSENMGGKMSDFYADIASDSLANLVLLDPAFSGPYQNDEHPPTNPQLGQKLVADVYSALAANPTVWKKTVFFLIYDEHGGYYDHVNPPQACQPDNYQPPTHSFGRLGFRVPILIASPYVRAGYVSHFVTDLTSVTRFIENRFDLPAMTARDANAWPLLDMFDFTSPPFLAPPSGAPSAMPNPAHVQWCASNPPGTGKP